MELMLVVRVLLRRWWLVVIPVIIVAVFVGRDFLQDRGVATGGYSVTVRYSASQDFSAIPGRNGDFQDVWLASELAINAMTDWVRTSSFVEEIKQGMALRNTEFDPAVLVITADNKHSVGQLTLSYPDEKVLDTIIAVALDVLKTRAQNYFPQLGGQPADVTILDTPLAVAAPPAIVNRFAPIIKLGLGLLAGIALAFVAEYLDPLVRRREQVEMLGLRVVGTLPRR